MVKVIRRCLMVLIFLVAGLSTFHGYSGVAPAQTTDSGKQKECRLCHAREANDLEVAGGEHKLVPCSRCHAGHPPAVKKPIAPCSDCHLKQTNIHFTLEKPGCLGCHTNPHRPMTILLKGADNDACIVCHWAATLRLKNNPSKHTALNCSTCHDVHRKIPQCTQCHKPHKGRIVGNCKACHQHAHKPKLSAFPSEVPSTDCGSCHKIVADLFGATTSKHKTLTCIDCHQMKHRFKPACQDCHGTPHPEDILAKFPECVMCHYSPHDLNNWPGTAATGTAEAPQKR